MTKYRDNLPQLAGKTLLTDSGLETTLYFKDGIELPEFAAYVVLQNEEGRQRVKDYLADHAKIALDHGLGLVLEAPTWRASAKWGEKIGHSRDEIASFNETAIQLLKEVRDEHETEDSPFVISGQVGPEDDGYNPQNFLSVEEAENYHAHQIGTFADAGVDMVSALTMCYAEEAIGVAKAAKAAGVPCVISFTVETDGNLPSGQSLKDAIAEVDAATDNSPIYYMINCAHPTHFHDAIEKGADWVGRIGSLRANASKMSHEELDNAEELDEGDPKELGQDYLALKAKMPNVRVIGGCCGTDHRHIGEIAKVWVD